MNQPDVHILKRRDQDPGNVIDQEGRTYAIQRSRVPVSLPAFP